MPPSARIIPSKGLSPPCYNAPMLPDLRLDDVVRLRKPHPCGGYEWKVVRLGADIGIECLTCGHRVLLPRRQLARKAKTITPHHESPDFSNG
jgi:hypothetical protein